MRGVTRKEGSYFAAAKWETSAARPRAAALQNTCYAAYLYSFNNAHKKHGGEQEI